MKLIYCLKCHDVIKLLEHSRTCFCGASGGFYTDNVQASFWGPAVPLGFANSSFVDAIEHQPKKHTGRKCGRRFEAFVIEKECPTMQKATFEITAAGREFLEKETPIQEVMRVMNGFLALLSVVLPHPNPQRRRHEQ